MPLDWSNVDVGAYEKAAEKWEDGEDLRVAKMLEEAEGLDLPASFTALENWDNYVDEELYLIEKRLREYLKHMRWYSMKNNGYRTSCSLAFTWMFGRPPQPEDGAICKKLNRLLEYYAYKTTGKTRIYNKNVPKAYWISKYGAWDRNPLSIKLRLELKQNGKKETSGLEDSDQEPAE